ncbi:hypothetical protein [Acinetobacter junii]|uniref:Uncharacterized protein n=1 Tax=Acinetobacter junii TaxID=40215 RepID=A0AAX1MET7_ACIJU|nr:hypothetical protein [Acinetobacter junii]QUY35615.1 hypothetical protein H2677_10025 [Acinetobacter junii]
MGLVLKSNTAMTLKKLTDLGLSGVTAHLDFRDATYKQGSTAVDLTSLLTCVRSTIGGSVNAYTEYTEVAANMLRNSYSASAAKKGLLIEGQFTNYFLNSQAPVSQSISISQATNIANVLDVIGTGSAKLYDASNNLLGTAIQGKPFVYVPSAAGTVTLNIVIEGSLQFCSYYTSIDCIRQVTRVKTTTASVQANTDIVKLITAKITEFLGSDLTGCIVVKQFVPGKIFDRNKTQARTSPILQFTTTDNNVGIFVNRAENSSLGNFLRVRTATPVETVKPTSLNLQQSNIFAVNVSPTAAQLAVNGEIGEEITFGAMALNKLCIGSGEAYSVNNTNYIEEILFFDRVLTIEELKMISTL